MLESVRVPEGIEGSWRAHSFTFRVSVVIFGASLLVGLACEGSGLSCRECDPDSEVCVEFRSDIDEPAMFECAELPSVCEDDPTCACLEENTAVEGTSLFFCDGQGRCDDDGRVMEVSCPGG